MSDADRTPARARCGSCNHEWVAAWLPMELGKVARLLKGMHCPACGRPQPTMDADTYASRAIPRLAAIDRLSSRIDFSMPSWKYTPEGERWQRLMDEQIADEVAAGL